MFYVAILSFYSNDVSFPADDKSSDVDQPIVEVRLVAKMRCVAVWCHWV